MIGTMRAVKTMNIGCHEIELRLMATREEIIATQRLRYRKYVIEKQWEPRNDQGIEADEYDERAIHYGLFMGGNLVGCARLVMGAVAGTLPIVEEVPGVRFDLDEIGTSLEISRVVILKGIPAPAMLTEWMYRHLFRVAYAEKCVAAYVLLQDIHHRYLRIKFRNELQIDMLGKAFVFRQGYKHVPIRIYVEPESQNLP